jgi:hypothetical protein
MNPDESAQQKQQLQALLTQILVAEAQGLSEYALFGELAKRGVQGFSSTVHDDNLSLFRAHFLLFHVLYELRETLWRQHGAELNICCLKIVLRPGQHNLDHGSDATPVPFDVLRAYYGDLNNLANTSGDDVESMLADFWNAMSMLGKRDEALAVLGLDTAANDDDIKHRYRQLALQHHPDRGGDQERLQAINIAMDKLKRKR